MGVLGMAEGAVETVTGARWWRIALRFAPWAAIVVLAVGLQLTRATLARVRLEHRAERAEGERDAAVSSARSLDRAAKAADSYASRAANVRPVIVRATNEVTRYAETPLGRARCLDIDRAVGVREGRSELFSAVAPAPAGGGDTAVPAIGAADAAGRLDDERGRGASDPGR